jgi:simple sugar transport system ATP-binding protein
MGEYAVELRGITKIYPETRYLANNHIDLALRKGEILCLAGENGAGKSTLMKILYGLTPPTSGEILVWGKPAVLSSPKAAKALGIGMAHQHFMLFPEYTAAENVVLGLEPVTKLGLYDFKKARRQVAELIEAQGFSIDPDDRVSSLTVGQMQQVEILKMLYRKADILILDEPTAVLTEQEIDPLFKTLRRLSDQGKSLFLITHKLAEIKRVSHRVAVMRQGELIGIRDAKEINEYDMVRMMIGRGYDFTDNRKEQSRTAGEPVLTFDQVGVKHKRQERALLDRISFTVRRGEIVGFTGAGGNGLDVLEAVLGGLTPITAGRILCGGRDISGLDARGLRRRGLAYAPADRMGLGSALEAKVLENLILGRRKEFAPRGLLDIKAAARFCQTLLKRYAIKGDPEHPISSLSGGNIQKALLAREIDLFRDYIVFSEPAWGLDAAASRFVYEQISALREKGAAILLLSSNLDELIAHADRVAVFYRGAIAAELPDPRSSPGVKARIGAAMLGLPQIT